MEWNKASWANLVDKGEYRKYIRVTNLAAGSMVFSVLIEALADAADDTGLLRSLDLPAFYTTHVAKVVCTPDAEHPGFRALTYDAFVATALLENLQRLLMAGLLAQSTATNTYDYHLALPAPVGENLAAGLAQEAADAEREAGR